MAKSKKIVAEDIKAQEVKPIVAEDVEKEDKDLDKDTTEAPEVEKTTEEVKDEVVEDQEAEKDLIVLSDGATVEEGAKLSEEEEDDLAKITKVDGTEIFIVAPEGDEEQKKQVYEAILEAETPVETEVDAEGLETEVNSPELVDEEIDEVAYVPAACHTAEASLNNSYYVVKLASGKLKALKAGKIFNKDLKASILKAFNEGKNLDGIEEKVFSKIASKIGNTFGAFAKLASKLSNIKEETKVEETIKKVVATELPDPVPGKENQDAEELKNFSVDESEIKKTNIDSEVALEKAKLEEGKEGVKSAPSKVKSLFNRLPGKSGVGDEVEWSLKEFNKERNKQDKTLASQVKALRDATKEIRAQKEVLASKEAEIKALQEKLAVANQKEETMIKSAKINKIIASMNIVDEEEKAAMTEKFAKYTKAQLDAVYETMTACPSEEATIMHERMINEEMKKEASALQGFVPSFKFEEEVRTSDSDEMEKRILERELDFINR